MENWKIEFSKHTQRNVIDLILYFFHQAYYGGEARCDVEMGENFNPEELVCGGCSDIAKAQVNLYLDDVKLTLNLMLKSSSFV